MATTLTRTFPRSPAAAQAARESLAVLSPEVSREALEDLRLVASELVTNSVRHGGSRNVDLTVDVCGDVVRLEVVDGGPGFELGTRSDGPLGGWGLVLVDRIADRWGIRNAYGVAVWAELDLERRAPARDWARTAA
jgi:anti-sigma regulatory factor (Ser/Thr protein kinase)